MCISAYNYYTNNIVVGKLLGIEGAWEGKSPLTPPPLLIE